MAKARDELLSSNYDGIQEYDNDLPRWWLALFYVTIAFSAVYSFYYHLGPGPSSEQSLADALGALEKVKAPAGAAAPEGGDDLLLALTKEPTHLASGKAVFDTRCAACHGAEGQGLVGPNLTDDFFIHGAKPSDVHKVIRDGVLEKGMLAWKGMLTDEQIRDVTAYVYTLRGTNPPNPKAPQGEKLSADG